ncbi:hypothetical protein NP233_g6401 [Leucocoprinus birnbaumii]|uniref:MATE efflux family protein n=1 Tax=Leucocoprinus birnbaumii TaxID=56174 RepID=A0AAD5VR29_9AGAR|nr:hypothetical protein NP233_g6401 [Leucocoprinus birnbaumii]
MTVTQQEQSPSTDTTISYLGRHDELVKRISTGTRDSLIESESSTISETTPLLPSATHQGKPVEDDNGKFVQTLMEELPVLGWFALPTFGSQFLEYGLGVVSVISIGHLSTTALAAASLGSMTASLSGWGVISGLTSALDTLLPSTWTSDRPQFVGLWAQRMCIVTAAFSVFTLTVWFNAEPILLALKQDPEVARLASLYLRWSSLGLPAYAFNNISRRYFQAQNLFSIPTHIIVVVTPFNILFNYLLVWGPESVRLGFIGAPLATAISFNLISVLYIIYGVFFVPKTAWHPISRQMFSGLGVLIRLGLSGIAEVGSDYWAWDGVAFGASFLGPVALASQSVLLTTTATMYSGPLALGMATAVRIGNLLGERRAKRARVAAFAGMIWALTYATLTSTMLLVLRNSWARIFNNDPEVVTKVAGIIPLVATFQAFDGITSVAGGIMRSQGRQFTGAVLIFCSYFLFGIPVGMVLAFKYKKDLFGIWTGMTIALVCCAFLGTWLAFRTDWDYELEKAQRRLAEEKERARKMKRAPLEEGAQE